MIAALFIAGPAVLLAIMAWALDRFMPVPSPSAEAGAREARPSEATVTRRANVPSRPATDAIQRLFDDAEDAPGFMPLARALQRFELKRSRSMAEDRYPDPVHNRYEDTNSMELQTQKLIFQKDGRVRLEARSAGIERGRPASPAGQ